MSVLTKLSALVLTGTIDRASQAVGVGTVGRSVAAFLQHHLTDHSQKLTDALRTATERAWTALEVALAGDTFWQRCTSALASAEDRSFRGQVRAFLDATILAGDGDRQEALTQLQAARKAGVLDATGIDAGAVAGRVTDFARHADPTELLAAEWQAATRLGDDLRADYPALARVVSARPADGMPVLVVAARYFFRRQVEADPELFRGLAVAQLDRLSAAQEEGYAGLDAALAEQGDRLHALLADVREVVVETHGAVLDLQVQVEGQSEQVRQIAKAVEKLLDQHQLSRRELRPGDSLSIRNDRERELVKQLVARYRSLPEADRKNVPALLNAVGKLEVVTGNFDAAQKDFQAVAEIERDNKAKAEAHHNAYRAALERRDWPGAIQELIKAINLNPKRFAPFPTGKYQPVRILGAGGFGVAFLCKHKLMDARVVIKTLLLDDLGRDADKVFTEAQVIRQLDHPAVIRISDCGYVDAAKKSRPFIEMDYFEGGTLEEQVKSHGPLPVPDLLAVARQVADGLHAANEKGILHRDVKPANLLVRQDGAVWKAKVIDFGLAQQQKVVQKSVNASTATRNKTLVGDSIAGTLDYGPPEQMGKRADPVGPYSDVYGWAKTCCFALFQTSQPTLRHWQSVPQPLAELLGRCLEDDPKARPQGFADVLTALDRLADAPAPESKVGRSVASDAEVFGPVTAKSERTTKRPVKPSRRPLVIGGVVVAALFLLVGVVWIGYSVVRAKRGPASPPDAFDPQGKTATPGERDKLILVQFRQSSVTLAKGGTAKLQLSVSRLGGTDSDVTVRLDAGRGLTVPAKVVVGRGQEELEIEVRAGDEAGVYVVKATVVPENSAPMPAECRVSVSGVPAGAGDMGPGGTPPPDPPEDGVEKEDARRLLGRWEVMDGPGKGATITFRDDGKALLTRPGAKNPTPISSASFRVQKLIRRVDIVLSSPDAKVLGDDPHYAMDFLADDELVLSETSSKGKGPFSGLAGRLTRSGAK